MILSQNAYSISKYFLYLIVLIKYEVIKLELCPTPT